MAKIYFPLGGSQAVLKEMVWYLTVQMIEIDCRQAKSVGGKDVRRVVRGGPGELQVYIFFDYLIGIFLSQYQNMVIKTELCHFSEWKIYPGRGIRFIAKDGRPFLYLSKRTKDFGLRKLKAQRLRWTTAWRRLHKKLKQTDQGKNKKKKVFRKQRAIEGVTLEDIRKLKTARPEDKKALAEEAIREIKQRKRALAAKKAGDKKPAKDKNTQQKAQEKAAQKAQKKTAGGKKK